MKQTLEERFWMKVDRRGHDECWPWLACKTHNGYGRFGMNGTVKLAHRVAYELCIGPIPDDLVIDHVRARGCTMRHCVNPAHLEPVPFKTNINRGRNRELEKTHCRHGHPYDDKNTYRWRNIRYCRACLARRARERRAVR